MVEITSIRFADEYLGTSNPFLFGSIFDKQIATVLFNVHWESLGVTVTFDHTNNTITRSDGKSWLDAGFIIGDTFAIVGTGYYAADDGIFTIADLSASVITTVESIPYSASFSNVDFHGTTPINALDFYFNLIENSSPINYVSLTDNNTLQKRTAAKSVWSTGDIISLNPATISQAWDNKIGINPPTVTKTSISGYKQVFSLTHEFFVAPFFLSGQQNNVASTLAGIPSLPDYFNTNKCLKYVCQIDGRFSTNDPNVCHTSKNGPFVFSTGNTGFFNEKGNAQPPEYSMQSITLTDASGNPLTRLNADKDCNVSVVLNSATAQFSTSPATILAVGIIYAPLQDSEYKNTPTDIVYNYKYDRKLITNVSAAVNGERFGGDLQSLIAISTTPTNGGQITVSFKVSLSAFMKNFITSKPDTDRNYLIYITPQAGTDHEGLFLDRNAIICAFDNYDIVTEDPELLNFTQDILFYEYPNTTSCAFTDYKGWIQDGVLSKTQFQILKGAILKDIDVKIQAYNSGTGAAFDLESFPINFAGQYSSQNEIVNPTSISRGFKLSSTDPRNLVTFSRNGAIDSPTYFGYELDYGNKLRYETWRDVPLFDQAFTANHSEDWSLYSLAPGWEVRYLFIANVADETTGVVTEFDRIANITIKNASFSDNGFGHPITSKTETFIQVGMG